MPRIMRRKFLVVFALASLLLWLGSSFFVTRKLTHRAEAIYAQPAPVVTWATIENTRLTTDDAQQIGAWFVGSGSRPVSVLILHGNGGSRQWALPMMRLLAESGYSSLAISLRGHGDSTGDRVDFGYSDRHDVIAAVAFIRLQQPSHKIVIVGSSLGAAAACFAAGELGTTVDGYLFDSPYQDLRTAVKNRLEMELPPILDLAAYAGLRLWAPLFLPVGVSEISPCNAAAHIPRSVPVTILASAADDHARLAEAQAYERCLAGHCRLITVSNSPHGAIFGTNREVYTRALFELLEDVER